MKSRLNLAPIAAAIFMFMGTDMRMVHAQGDKSPSGSGCPLLTSAIIERVLGQHLQSDPAQEALPMYGGGASGLSCRYHGGGIRIDFAVYTETSPAEAKRTFDRYSVAADDSKGRPSIGDSAYWVTATKRQRYIYVLKGKVHFGIGMSGGSDTQLQNLASAAASGI